jgi:alkylhydroperoxidase family enzyme
VATLMANSTPDGTVTEELLARLQAAFTDGQIIEIAMVIAVLCGMAKLLFTFDLAEREDYCTFPHQ